MDDELRIISVKAKKNGQSCIICLNDGEAFECSYDLVLKFRLGNNSIISEKILQELKKEQRLYDAKQTAYNFVSYKPRTEKQIRQRLKIKGFENDEANSAIEFLIKFDLVDDIKYAKQFVSDYLKRKSTGKSKLLFELLKKGIDKSLAEDTIEKFYPEENTFEIAMKSIEKKLRLIRHKPMEKQKDSLIRYMQSSGFDWDIIRKVLKKVHFGEDE
ncbi:MAG: RecX family transcriptional regulator [Ignavibacteriae bacterium]|nr:RecX family transcriptional regulator [Ignavibacteriota bacterium]